MNDVVITCCTARQVFAVSFALNFVWENVQALLYGRYESFLLHLPACLVGTLGDATFTTLLCLSVTRAARDPWWFTCSSRATSAATASAGLLVAAVTEVIALRRGFWSYGQRCRACHCWAWASRISCSLLRCPS